MQDPSLERVVSFAGGGGRRLEDFDDPPRRPIDSDSSRRVRPTALLDGLSSYVAILRGFMTPFRGFGRDARLGKLIDSAYARADVNPRQRGPGPVR